jgi:hypothetical protein
MQGKEDVKRGGGRKKKIKRMNFNCGNSESEGGNNDINYPATTFSLSRNVSFPRSHDIL